MGCLRKPLTLGDGSPWEFRYSCRSITRIFGQLVISDFLANERLLFPVLGIDRATRELKDNETETSGNAKRSRIKKLRWITSFGPSRLATAQGTRRFLCESETFALYLGCGQDSAGAGVQRNGIEREQEKTGD